jgi:putative transposase
MPRSNRVDVGGEIYHVINRANARVQIFDNQDDYQLFENVLLEAKERTDMCIYGYCVMPNHWHLILSPINDGDLSKFMGWLTMTHTQRWHAAHKTTGSGHLYQGRYKSFIVQSNEYFLQLMRYVERNPIRAKLIRKAENWQWGSLWRREKGTYEQKKLLSALPAPLPSKYLSWVNEPEEREILEEIRYSVNKGKPYGKEKWTDKMVDRFKIAATLRHPGRPQKGS